MKNIHILPTDKPSRLFEFMTQLILSDKIISGEDGLNKNIYITNDEEIKEGDLIFSTKTNNIFKADSIEYLESHNIIEDFDKLFYINSKYAKKIILTTDQNLDGVQAIDDEFLEWFVKNSSCESIEVKSKIIKDGVYTDLKGYVELPTIHSINYKILIPQEEPKQDLEKEMFKLEQEPNIPSSMRWYNSKPKQETLEEAALKFNRQPLLVTVKDGFIEGAKWQQKHHKIDTDDAYSEGFENGKKFEQERSYSEKEVLALLIKMNYWSTSNTGKTEVNSWFEQFKKK